MSSDLVADLSAELTAPRAVAAPVRPSVPAVAVLFTPLHWVRPSVGRPGAGAGVVLRGGPWQVDVRL